MDILDRFVEKFLQTFEPEIAEAELDEFMLEIRTELGGEKHWVASARAMEVAQKHLEVRRLIRQGLGNSAISERVGLTRQQVWNIRQEMTVRS